MPTDHDDWSALQERSHLPEAQAAIRAAVRAGAIRIAPLGGGWVRIIPLGPGRSAVVPPPAPPAPPLRVVRGPDPGFKPDGLGRSLGRTPAGRRG